MLKPLDKPYTIKIHFIIGATRSGTSLLLQILNHHKNCVSSGETKHLLLGYKKYNRITEVTPNLLRDFFRYKRIKGNKNPQTKLFSLGEKMNYFEFCRRIYFRRAKNKIDTSHINTIIDKNPFYTLMTEELIQILPDAKFLCAVRDYRGFVLSNKQSREPFAKSFSVVNYSIIWLFYYKYIVQLQKKYPEKTLQVKYENFVTNKEETLKEICSFLKIKYDPDCFNYQENVREKFAEKITNDRIQHKLNSLLKPIHATRAYAWQEPNTFTIMQHKIMDFWCSKIGTEFGYEKTTHTNFATATWIWLISLPCYIKTWIYFNLKSVRLNFYLNDVRKTKHTQKNIF